MSGTGLGLPDCQQVALGQPTTMEHAHQAVLSTPGIVVHSEYTSKLADVAKHRVGH
jgi:hypothetical protein